MTTLLAATFLLVQLLCQLLATVECCCDIRWDYDIHAGRTRMKIHTDHVTWDEARQRCVSEGAHLAVATTPQEVEFIQNRGVSSWIWIGISRPTNTSDWTRVDTGLPVASPLPWFVRDSNDDLRCAATVFSKGMITNTYCDLTIPFVCEISPDEVVCPNPPGAPSYWQDTVVAAQVP